MIVKTKIRKFIIFFAAAAILCSSAYILYDLAWVPAHFKKLNNEISAAESSHVAESQKNSDIQKKYRFIKNKYPDFSGRLSIDGLGLDFPVAQCQNNSYYLRHTLDGDTDKHGTLFADCRNNLEELDIIDPFLEVL